MDGSTHAALSVCVHCTTHTHSPSVCCPLCVWTSVRLTPTGGTLVTDGECVVYWGSQQAAWGRGMRINFTTTKQSARHMLQLNPSCLTSLIMQQPPHCLHTRQAGPLACCMPEFIASQQRGSVTLLVDFGVVVCCGLLTCTCLCVCLFVPSALQAAPHACSLHTCPSLLAHQLQTHCR